MIDFSGRTAISWIRWSSKKQDDTDSVRRQQDEFDRAINETGAIACNQQFIAEAKSAWKGKHKEKLGEIKLMAQANPNVRYVLFIEKVDRLTRLKIWDSLELIGDLLKYIDIYFISKSEYCDESSKNDLLSLLKLMLEFDRANNYSESISIHTHANHLNEFKKTLETGKAYKIGKNPHWLDVVDDYYVVNEDAAKTIRYIFDMYTNDGIGTQRMGKRLESEGIKHIDGKDWTMWRLIEIIKNEAVNGWFTSKRRGKNLERLDTENNIRNGIRAKIYPPIIDDAQWAKAQLIRAANSKGNKAKNKNGNNPIMVGVGSYARPSSDYLLSGKLACKECGQNYVKAKRTLRCKISSTSSICSAMSMPLILAEQCIAKALFDELTASELFDNTTKKNDESNIKVEIEAVQIEVYQLREKIKTLGSRAPVSLSLMLADKEVLLAELQSKLGAAVELARGSYDEVKLNFNRAFEDEAIRLKLKSVISLLVKQIYTFRINDKPAFEVHMYNGMVYRVLYTYRKRVDGRFQYWCSVNSLTHRMPYRKITDEGEKTVYFEGGFLS